MENKFIVIGVTSFHDSSMEFMFGPATYKECQAEVDRLHAEQTDLPEWLIVTQVASVEHTLKTAATA